MTSSLIRNLQYTAYCALNNCRRQLKFSPRRGKKEPDAPSESPRDLSSEEIQTITPELMRRHGYTKS